MQQALAGNAEVKNSLKRLCIFGLDPRLASERSAVLSLRKTALNTRRHYRGFEGHKDSAGNVLEGSYTIDIDEQGRITGLSPEKMRSLSDTEERESQDVLEQRAAKQREDKERAFLEKGTVDWELLKTDFDGFVEKYQLPLRPITRETIDGEEITVTQVDGVFPFAEAFMQKVNEDIEILGPKVKDFLPKNFRYAHGAVVPLSHLLWTIRIICFP